MEISLYLLSVIVTLVTALPIWRTSRWWIRLWDFPRFQIAIAAAVLLSFFVARQWPLEGMDLALCAALATSIAWQLSWIWRYVPVAPVEVKSYPKQDEVSRLALLTTNVFQPSRISETIIKIIRREAPDIVLAVETDEWWCSRLEEGLSSVYSHRVVYALSNGYGLALFSRLELVAPSIRFVIDEAIPSIKTGVRLRSGAVIQLYCVHPQPPSLLQDSAERDNELLLIAKEICRSGLPSVVLGDLNDVAWSPTTVAFKKEGGLLDPRRGRGFFSTYPASMPGLRYPLDHIFHTSHFAVQSLRVLERFESDHLPFSSILCLAEPKA
jgi:endonuclease/exonuclease/phosphatase (EEP) superfamily protein YafD